MELQSRVTALEIALEKTDVKHVEETAVKLNFGLVSGSPRTEIKTDVETEFETEFETEVVKSEQTEGLSFGVVGGPPTLYTEVVTTAESGSSSVKSLKPTSFSTLRSDLADLKSCSATRPVHRRWHRQYEHRQYLPCGADCF